MTVDNRRENYRHEFGQGETLLAEVENCKDGKIFIGEVFSLSAGGIGVKVPRKDRLFVAKDQILVRFTLPGADVPFALRCEVRHSFAKDNHWQYGLQFLNSENAMSDTARDKLIWKYLMELQRRAGRTS